MRFREATPEDAEAVGRLHAESWRIHYRGAYRDDYLDGNVVEDRVAVWTERLRAPVPNQRVVLAEDDDELIGFACVYGGEDKRWGSFLDNIHVRPNRQSRGVGEALMAEVVRLCRAQHPDRGMYLWVLAGNHRAQQFYRRLGARDAGGEHSEPPGGGRIHGRRYVWDGLPDLPAP